MMRRTLRLSAIVLILITLKNLSTAKSQTELSFAISSADSTING